MYRWHKDYKHSKRENIKHLRNIHNWPREEVDCVCDVQIGRFRKSKGLGCRKRNCFCKWYTKGYPTYKDKLADIVFKEELASLS